MIAETRPFDLLSVGEVLLDFVAPDADTLMEAVDFVRAPGGAPANVAVAVARLGGSSALVAAVGDDPFGRGLSMLLDRSGIDTSGVRTVRQRTTLAFVARNAGMIPDFLFYRGADTELRPEDVPADMVSRSHFLYVSSMALLSEPSSSATQYAIELAREAGTLVAVDPNLRPSSWPSLAEARAAILPLVHAADLLKVNDEEARLLAHTGDLEEAIASLAEGGRLVVVTLGAEGCRWRAGDSEGKVTSPRVTVRETTGAGDAFMGALLTELAAARFAPGALAPLDIAGLESALSFACAAGARACTRLGAMTSLPIREEVEELLRVNKPLGT